MKYNFLQSDCCNMCGSPQSQQIIIGKRLNKSQGLRPSKKSGITTTVFKCCNCDLIYSNPMPIPVNIQDHYGVLPESYWTENYFKQKLNIENLVKKLEKHFDFTQSLKALDIGAGVGKMMKAMEEKGMDVYGIEPSIQFHERAMNKMGISAEKIQCVAIEDANFPENYFDFITFGAVLEHLANPNEALKKAMYWLKPGGIVEVKVPSSNWLIGKIFNSIYKLSFTDYCSNLSPMHSPFHLYEFGKKSFESNAKINNYIIADIEFGICQTFLPKILDGILKPIMKKTNTGMEIYILLKKTKN